MDRLGLELYPGEYQPVRAAGPKGDTKNDGYCPKARVFFAAHATRGERIDKTKAKIHGDLEGCLQEHRDVRADVVGSGNVEVTPVVGPAQLISASRLW
ncbi:hypothetical protein [Streptomyces sp. NPDC001530]|uniref:hypothetical protein n=1 Tax=Streptomyces sp. NPDC001530 TaxID=3364582 RepID=UPI0036C94C27